MTKPERVYISLGSCMTEGDRLMYLRAAAGYLGKLIAIEQISNLYTAVLDGAVDDEEWISAVAVGMTDLKPMELLKGLQAIERHMGRIDDERQVHAPIDLDILFFGSIHMESTELIIPHPRIQQRPILLKPMVDLNPDLIHPKLHYTVSQLLQDAREPDEAYLYRP